MKKTMRIAVLFSILFITPLIFPAGTFPNGEESNLAFHVQDYPNSVIISFEPHSAVNIDGRRFTGPQPARLEKINESLDSLPVREIRNLLGRQDPRLRERLEANYDARTDEFELLRNRKLGMSIHAE